jgi:hypothetical protein
VRGPRPRREIVGLAAFRIPPRVVQEVRVAFVDRVVGEVFVEVLGCALDVADQ